MMRLRAEDEIRSASRRAIFRSLVSAPQDAWMLVDQHGLVRMTSPNWAALRFDPKQMRGQPARRYVRGLFGMHGGLIEPGLPECQVMVFDQPGVILVRPDGMLLPAVVRAARVPTRTGWLVGISAHVRKPGKEGDPVHARDTLEKFGATARDDELARGIGASGRVALRALGAQAFHLLRLTAHGLQVAHAIASPLLMSPAATVRHTMDTPEGQALRGGRPVVVGESFRLPARPEWWPADAHSALIVPLRVSGRIDGLVEIWSTTPRAFDRDDVAFTTAVADLMGASLDAFAWQSRVRAHREQLRQLSRRLMSVQESERRHLARELHDELGQVLTALKMEVTAAAEGNERTARSRLGTAVGMIDRMIAQVRSISLDLRPPGLDELGLAAALRWYVHQLRDRAGLDVQLVASTVMVRPPPEIEQACFRIVQEALTNATRHARARRVRVIVRQRGSSLAVSVSDDGVGFDVDVAQARGREGSSLGLIGMRERAELAGGRFHVRSQRGRGTTITAQLSWRAPASPMPDEEQGTGLEPAAAAAPGQAHPGGKSL